MEVLHPAIDATKKLHYIQCPVVFTSGPIKPDLPGFDGLLPDAAQTLASRLQDAAHMVVSNGTHFMPFTMPEQLAACVFRALLPADGGDLRRHIRWLAVDLDAEQSGLHNARIQSKI